MVDSDPKAVAVELARIDEELGRLPPGQLVERRKGSEAWIFRLFKRDGRDRYEAIGPVDGPEHLAAREASRRRQELGRRRRDLARALDAPTNPERRAD